MKPTYIQTVRRKLADGTHNEHYYLRTPPSMRHVLGKRVRLPNDLAAATKHAEKLLNDNVRVIDGVDARLYRFARRAHDNAFSRANKRGQEYELSRELIIQMMEKQRYLCDVSGLPFSLDWERGKNPFAPSLDRKDNAKGYTLENTRLVLSAVNFGMNVWGLEIYTAICAGVAHKQNKIVNFDVNRFSKTVNGSNSVDEEPAK